MKRLVVLIVLFLGVQSIHAQNFLELASHEFSSKESYKPAEKQVISCADYLLSTPSDTNKVNRLIATQYILKWMEGTPDYTFEITSEAVELTKGNEELLGLYFASMSKVVLEHKEGKLTSNKVYERAKDLVVAYCAKKSNKMKPSKKIKKIIKSRKG